MYAIALASLGVLMVATSDVALSQGAPSGAAPLFHGGIGVLFGG